MTSEYMKYSSDEFDMPSEIGGEGKREKRLERNRESARKCRKKRKVFVEGLQEQVQGLSEENAMLELENRRLNELLLQLQGKNAGKNLAPPESKRLKSETRVTKANDFSESAVHATSLQQENISRLAAVTTCLLLTMLASTVDLLQHVATPVLAQAAQSQVVQSRLQLCKSPAPALKPSLDLSVSRQSYLMQ